MPETLKIAILAVVQGLTEFLPVSSSGHLVIANSFIGLDAPGVLWEVVIHVGTLLSVAVYYRNRIGRLVSGLAGRDGTEWKTAICLLIATVPIGLVGVLLKDRIEALFDKPEAVGLMLIVTGLTLLTVFKAPKNAHAPLTPLRALWIGLAQACAIIPGISRSGSTITMARHLGLAPREAAEFALLMMFPAIGGALAVALLDARETGLGSLTLTHMAIGLIVSALVGYGAIVWLVRALSSGAFPWFGVYCIAAGVLATIII